jgi:hypothetical protein
MFPLTAEMLAPSKSVASCAVLAAEVMAVIETEPEPVAVIVGSGVVPAFPIRTPRFELAVSV